MPRIWIYTIYMKYENMEYENIYDIYEIWIWKIKLLWIYCNLVSIFRGWISIDKGGHVLATQKHERLDSPWLNETNWLIESRKPQNVKSRLSQIGFWKAYGFFLVIKGLRWKH